jgi:7,8-dihydro-6-hydroxymethylpterin dimethyltransferase
MSAPHTDRDYLFHEMTRGLCPECLQTVDAKVLIQDNRVILRKWCPEHGSSDALVSGDAAYYLDAHRYNRPGRLPAQSVAPRERGCPWDCGICPDHEQHMCVGLIDITDGCNIRCPTCFAASHGRSYLSLEQIEYMMDAYIRLEGEPTVLQISGGEPTMHPRILDVLRLAARKSFRMIMLNTNGILLGRSPEFARELAELKDRIEVYLQFDSLDDDATERIRGGRYVELKRRAVEHCAANELPVHLACTLIKGVNDGEVGDLIRFGLATDYVRGINFQPAFCSGRYDHDHDPMDRLTLPDVLNGIERETRGVFRRTDFVPLPCSHPTCIAITYAWVDRGKVKPIPRFVDMERHMKHFANSIFIQPMDAYREALENIFSLSTVMSSARTLMDFSCVCGQPFKKAFFSGAERRKLHDQKLFRILVLQFEDRHTFDLKRVKKCCIGHVIPDGRVIPFCSYNTLYRQHYDVARWAGLAPGESPPGADPGPGRSPVLEFRAAPEHGALPVLTHVPDP